MLDFDNTFGTITVYCDNKGCNEEEEFEGFDGHCDLDNAREEMKRLGWKNKYVDGDWEHTCPMCSDK